MSKFGICGVSGRMGHAILTNMYKKEHELACAFDVESSPLYGKDAALEVVGKESGSKVGAISTEALEGVDSVIDFSAPQATVRLVEAALVSKTPLVIATTGFDADGEKLLQRAATEIPIVHSTNMSVGVNLLFKLTEIASKALGADYDAEVFEAHHRYKKDSPSGTATTLINTIKEFSEHLKSAEEAYRPRGIIGERPDNEVGVQVLRGGDIVGEHTVFFVGHGERLELTHRAIDRNIFADGAVRAAEFVKSQSPGIYSMFDVLGIG